MLAGAKFGGLSEAVWHSRVLPGLARGVQVAVVAEEYGLDGAHWGVEGRRSGVWGVDRAGLVTFVVVSP